MSYVAKLTEDQAVKDRDFPVEVKVYSAGTQVVPTAATVTVLDPDGTEIKAATAMSIALAGTLTYTVDELLLDELMEDAVLEIAFTVSSVVYKATYLFDVVLNALYCNVTDDDLKAYFPKIADDLWASVSNYSGQIDEAFKLIKRLIKDKGKRPAMLIDGSQVRELIIIKTFEMIFFNFSKSKDDVWWARYEKYAQLFGERFAGLVIKYDEDESGTIDGDEQDKNIAQPIMKR
jgi:hypothetical protein